ncbi:MAG: hypothetical protein ABIC91_05310 [Nanoarchaeota archaeon]|nr:hypothetical protein [Nanoarchaeota archaeon]
MVLGTEPSEDESEPLMINTIIENSSSSSANPDEKPRFDQFLPDIKFIDAWSFKNHDVFLELKFDSPLQDLPLLDYLLNSLEQEKIHISKIKSSDKETKISAETKVFNSKFTVGTNYASVNIEKRWDDYSSSVLLKILKDYTDKYKQISAQNDVKRNILLDYKIENEKGFLEDPNTTNNFLPPQNLICRWVDKSYKLRGLLKFKKDFFVPELSYALLKDFDIPINGIKHVKRTLVISGKTSSFNYNMNFTNLNFNGYLDMMDNHDSVELRINRIQSKRSKTEIALVRGVLMSYCKAYNTVETTPSNKK